MSNFPELDLATWQKTRDSLQVFAKLLGKIQQQLIPPQRHFWHYGLMVVGQGINTQPAKVDGKSVELRLDLNTHQLMITVGSQVEKLPLTGQSAVTICRQTLDILAKSGITVQIDESLFADEAPLAYQPASAVAFGQAVSRIAALTEKFKSSVIGETSPVQIFPHHFDLSLTWFSGLKVPGQDPADEEASDESMTLGFSTGDEGVPEAYLYVTAYPAPAGWTKAKLPAGASWHTQGWTGAELPYAVLTKQAAPDKLVLDFYRQAWQAGKVLMTNQ